MKRQAEINKLFDECLHGDPFPLIYHIKTEVPGHYSMNRLIDFGVRRFHVPEEKLSNLIDQIYGDNCTRFVV